VIELLVNFMRGLHPGLRISIIESDNFERRAGEVFRRLGYEGLAKKCNLELINLTDSQSFEVFVKEIPHTINLPRIFLHDVFFVSIALPKTHAYQKISSIYKNQFGCIPDKFKEKYHQYLEEVLYLLNNRLTVPDLCVIDGRIGMEGYGPVSGDRVESGFMLLTKDPTTADLACARIMGFDPRKIPYLKYACKRKGIDLNSNGIPMPLAGIKFRFIPRWEYRSIRGKIRVTRTTDILNSKIKRVVHIFFRLPSYIKERKLMPVKRNLRMRWESFRFERLPILKRDKD
jgi:uncharacterized protein (DUF362 family)